ncbi:MAG: dihydroorotase [Bacteroidota bacterium]
MLVLIRKARVVDPQSDFHDKVVDILIEDGNIKAIQTTIDTKADIVIEEEDLHISQGWVDVFADYREPGFEHKETIATGLQAAATGGFTQVLLAPNTNPTLSTKSIIQYVIRKAQGHIVQLHPMGALSQNIEGKDLAEMMDMHANGAVAFTDGWKPMQSSNLMLKALEYVKAIDATVVQIPIDTAIASGGLMHEGPNSTKLGMPGIPAIAETIMVHRDISLLRYTGSKLHITGVSSAESVEMIRAAKAEGLAVTCSVTPYHLALNDEILSTYDSLYKVAPPIREEADRKALVAGLKDGTIDCIATHHRPQEWDAKAKEFDYAADGMNVQEVAYPITWKAISKEVGINRLVDAMSVAARKIFGLKGSSIKVGNPAEITIFTISGNMPLTKEAVQSMSQNNPFIAKDTLGKVIGIVSHSQVHLNK